MLMCANDCPGTLEYGAKGFSVLCAVTGQPIVLEALRYWSVERQEAYASCEVATRALSGQA